MNIVQQFEEWRKKKPATSNVVEGKVTDMPKPVAAPKPHPKQVDYYERLAFIESSNNPKAKAKTSSASGLYQFIDSTWNEYVKKMGKDYTLDDRFDPKKAREVVEFKTNENARRLREALGREPDNTEKYMAHFLGLNGARQFLKAGPRTPVNKIVGQRQLEANRAVFLNKDGTPKRAIDVYEFFDKKFKGEE
jgi:hypothetical protein